MPTANSLPLTTAALVYGTVQPSRGNLLSVTAGFFSNFRKHDNRNNQPFTADGLLFTTVNKSVNDLKNLSMLMVFIYRSLLCCHPVGWVGGVDTQVFEYDNKVGAVGFSKSSR